MTRRFVSFDYILKNKTGEVLDSSTPDEPMEFVEGAGEIITGLESRMLSLKTGDKKGLTIPSSEAYGARVADLVIEVPRTELPTNQDLAEGMEFEVELTDGEQHLFRLTKLGTASATLDGNHPLAGQDLHFEVTVREIRTATDAEIENAEHDHENCDGHHNH